MMVSLSPSPTVRQALRLLLVEDSAADAELVAEVLERSIAAGELEVDTVDRISAAAELLSRSAVDCVLLDLSLPDLKGLDCVRAIRALDHDVAIVVLTGLTDRAMEDAAVSAGAQDFVRKDEIDPRTLLRSVRYAVERQGQQVLLRARAIEVVKSKARFQRAFDSAPVGMALVGLDGRFADVNMSLTEMLDYRASLLRRLRISDVVHQDNVDAFDGSFARLVDGSLTSLHMECRLSTLEARDVWVILSAAKVDDIGEGEPYVLVQAQDITALKSLEAGLVHQTLHDPLTGLPNRVALHDRLERALVRLERGSGAVAVFSIDLDGFKTVNDTFGHRRGDEVLVDVGQRLTAVCRPADTVARFGGDEFIGLAENLSGPDEALDLAERMWKAVGEAMASSCPTLSASSSIGIALTTDRHRNPDRLLEEADAAMYRAKERGKNCIELSGDPGRSAARGVRRAEEATP